jgi:transcriptional regulator with XRE-family HTH domain
MTSGTDDPGEGENGAPSGEGETAAPVDETRRLIGERLKAIRLERKLSLREAAERSGLSRTFVRLVERGETEIALSRFLRLTNSYGVFASDFLAAVHEPAVEYVPLAKAYKVPSSSADVEVVYLSSPSWQMQPFLVRLAPGARMEPIVHVGEEFLHCIAGTPTMVVAGSPVTMTVGDTLFLPEYAEHTYVNDGSEYAALVGAVLPPDRPFQSVDRLRVQASAPPDGSG